MTDPEAQLRNALLDLGLEDWIPIPEAVASSEVREAVGDGSVVEAVSQALRVLVREGRVRLYRGHWNEESDPVPLAEGLELLNDPKWYRFRLDEPGEERLYFVNADNVG